MAKTNTDNQLFAKLIDLNKKIKSYFGAYIIVGDFILGISNVDTDGPTIERFMHLYDKDIIDNFNGIFIESAQELSIAAKDFKKSKSIISGFPNGPISITTDDKLIYSCNIYNNDEFINNMLNEYKYINSLSKLKQFIDLEYDYIDEIAIDTLINKESVYWTDGLAEVYFTKTLCPKINASLEFGLSRLAKDSSSDGTYTVATKEPILIGGKSEDLYGNMHSVIKVLDLNYFYEPAN